MPDRDEMMQRVEGAVDAYGNACFAAGSFCWAASSPSVPARAALLTAIRDCLDWSPGCDGCRWDDGLVHTDCMECRRGSVMDHYAPAGEE